MIFYITCSLLSERMKALLKQRLKQNAFYLVYTRIKHFNKERLETFVGKYYDSKSGDLNKIKRALKICYFFGGVRYSEFYANHFENKTWRERMKLIPCSAQNNLFIQANSEEWLSILGNKGKCYGFFRNYYGRDVLAVPKDVVCEAGEYSDIVHFVEKHPVFIVKPLCSAGGIGVKMMDTASMGKDYLYELFDDYPSGFIMEDRIIQVEGMALLHRDSVNTINRARKISPEDEGLKKTAASLLLSAEKYEEAEKLIQEMNPAAEKDAEVMDLAGQYSILSGKTEEAASYASKIKALSPEYIAHLYSYATRYVQKGDYEHAKESVKAYIDEKMKDVPAWILLGQIDEAMGNKTEALDDYSTAVAFDPNNHLAGTLAKSLGDKIDAEVSLMEYSRTEEDMELPDTEEISLDEFDLGGLDEPEEKEEIPATIEGEESEEASDEGLKEENDADILGIDDDSPLFEDTDNEEDPDFINDDSDGIFAEEEAPAEEIPEEEKDEAEEEMPEINIEGADGAEGSGSSGEEAAESAGNFGDENAAESFESGETAGEPETADAFAEDAVASAGDVFPSAGSPVNSGAPESSEAPHPSVPDVPVEDITDERDDVSLDRMLAEDSAKRSSDALKEEAGKISQAVEEAARSAREASAAAEKSWLAAHDAAKSAEMAEKARQERAEDAYEKLVDQVNDMLPRLKTVLEDVGDAEKFREEIALFKRLRQLGESLPFEQRAKFLTSRVRLLLDYIISRLSGNPGLLTKATEIRKQTNLPIDGSDSNASINNHNDVINCIKHMESLSFYLKDENLYKALFAAAEEVVEKL